jgi:hypothetical protein
MKSDDENSEWKHEGRRKVNIFYDYNGKSMVIKVIFPKSGVRVGEGDFTEDRCAY